MRPDEWRQGMENEAASVEDREWAQETRQVVRRVHWGHLLVGQLLIGQTLLAVLTLPLLYFPDTRRSEPGLWLALIALGVSIVTWWHRRTRRAALAALLAWPALASTSRGAELLGIALPPPWLLLMLSGVGLTVLLLEESGRRKLTP